MKNDGAAIPTFGVNSRAGASDTQSIRARRRAAFVPPDRALHLVDVENLMGGPLGGQLALDAAVGAYRALVTVSVLDHVVVGGNPGVALAVAEAWPDARLVVRGGPDGADRALLEVVNDADWIATRYDRVVVGSGDGIFSAAVAGLRSAGIPVDVVSRAASLSLALVAVASSVTLLPVGKESLA